MSEHRPKKFHKKPSGGKLKDLEKQFFGFTYQHVHIRKLSELIFFLNSNRITHSYVSQELPDFFAHATQMFFGLQPEIWASFYKKQSKENFKGLADFINR